MSDKSIPFVVTDRRKFTTEGEPRPDADPSPERHRDPIPPAPELAPAPPSSARVGSSEAGALGLASETWENPSRISQEALTPEPSDPDLPPAPTPEQMEQSRVAFEATADRLDTALRAANPGADHPPALTFESLVQSVYMQAILQLGGGAQPGQQPQLDILGARQSIDMLAILTLKTSGNLSPAEEALLSSALFELRLAFLEVTQALSRSAQQRAGAVSGEPIPGQRPGPNLVR